MTSLVDIAHMIATAERAMSDGATSIGYPIARDVLALLRDHPAAAVLRSDLETLDAALRMRDGWMLLNKLRDILDQIPSVFGREAAEAVDTVRAAR